MKYLDRFLAKQAASNTGEPLPIVPLSSEPLPEHPNLPTPQPAETQRLGATPSVAAGCQSTLESQPVGEPAIPAPHTQITPTPAASLTAPDIKLPFPAQDLARAGVGMADRSFRKEQEFVVTKVPAPNFKIPSLPELDEFYPLYDSPQQDKSSDSTTSPLSKPTELPDEASITDEPVATSGFDSFDSEETTGTTSTISFENTGTLSTVSFGGAETMEPSKFFRLHIEPSPHLECDNSIAHPEDNEQPAPAPAVPSLTEQPQQEAQQESQPESQSTPQKYFYPADHYDPVKARAYARTQKGRRRRFLLRCADRHEAKQRAREAAENVTPESSGPQPTGPDPFVAREPHYLDGQNLEGEKHESE